MNTSKEAWGDPANLATLMIDLAAHKQTALAEKLRGMRDGIKPVADGLGRWRDLQISRSDYASFIGMKAVSAPCHHPPGKWSRTSFRR
jgi:hypothetical protein